MVTENITASVANATAWRRRDVGAVIIIDLHLSSAGTAGEQAARQRLRQA
jgi:deoxycytidylate deaminase